MSSADNRRGLPHWLGKLCLAKNYYMCDKICKSLALIITPFALLQLAGCATRPDYQSHPPTPPTAAKRALRAIGEDMKQVGKDLRPPKTSDTTQLGKDEQKLGNDMSTLSFALQSVGKYGSSPLSSHLGTLGTDLAKPATDIAQLGSSLQKDSSQVSAAKNTLQSDLAAAKGDLATIAGDLSTHGVPDDMPEFVSVKADIKTWIAHLQTLNGHLAGSPDFDTLGPDLDALGTDFSSLSGLRRTAGTNIFGNPRIVSGYITLNPYTITSVANPAGGTAEKLQGSSTTGAATIQVDYARRWAWDERSTIITPAQTIINGIPFGRLSSYDIQFRGGYTFTSSSNASTIIGSGNVDLEMGGGLQLVRWASARNATSINLDAGVETESDRAFASAHNTYFVGPAYVTSMVPPWTTNRAFMMFRMGSAFYDIPAFTAGGYVATNGIGGPKYSLVDGLAMEIEAAYPLTPESFIVANTRIYPTHSIAPWSLWIGLSVSEDQILSVAKSLGTALGITSSSSTSAAGGTTGGSSNSGSE